MGLDTEGSSTALAEGASDDHSHDTAPRLRGAVSSRLTGQWEFVREELLLSIGVLPFVFSRLGPVVKAFEFGGWADTIVGHWVPLVSALTDSIVWLLALLAENPISAPFRPFVALFLELLALLVFAFRRFGWRPFFIQAPLKFGWLRTFAHSAVHLAACLVLFAFMAAAIQLSVTSVISDIQDLLVGPGLTDAAGLFDQVVVFGVAAMVAILLLWHPGIAVRVLAIFLLLLAFDWLTAGATCAVNQRALGPCLGW